MSLDVVYCSLIELINATDESIKSSLLERNALPPQNSPSRKELLLAAIQCRDATNQKPDLKTPETAMKRVLAMTVDEITSKAQSDPAGLQDLLRRAHSYDTTLPNPPVQPSAPQLASIAMSWKLKSLETINNAQNSSLQGAVLLPDVPPPLSEPLNLDALLGTKETEENQANTSSPNGNHSPPHKKAKTSISVGGILIIDENGKSTPNRPPRLGPYPSNSTQKPPLCVIELVAFKLLRGLLQKGRCLESTVADVQWF
ncbi:hypothetical protein BWQ96_09823 [Gracilariopsis chorda]|uniref:Uncharacterized protein n=1 Tax=Gracilariopsis chorda TaxID=448386 RepID=A0A2V3IEE9_9FLOR|nr:hypothetical protein BWQ96_09823 [Gracilariopsis chorda]|eukprot:PXF40447.1 hypothetical protein BWQ96_09823 [Gracilariopsis chorda]